LSDSATDVAEFVAGEIAYAFAVKEDDCGYNGEGTSGFGGIAGLATNCRPDEKHGALMKNMELCRRGPRQKSSRAWPAVRVGDDLD
jgi:hypothetical protein